MFSQLYGYGGFGYDTSHVPPNESYSTMESAARDGNLETIKAAVSGAKSAEEKRVVLNKARRWTEVDYKMSGFTKEHEWYDVTPLAAAVRAGHDACVEFLLVEGADPTLQGCPTDDIYWDAFESAQNLKGTSSAVLALEKVDTSTFKKNSLPRPGQTPKERAKEVLKQNQKNDRIIAMLQAAKPFWKTADYSSPHYSNNCRQRAGYKNDPTDRQGLVDAVKAAGSTISSEAEVQKLATKIEDVQSSLGKETTKKKASTNSQDKMICGKRKSDGSEPGRTCAKCSQAKPVAEFSKNQRKKGPSGKCKACV